jgi:hypothetical protein
LALDGSRRSTGAYKFVRDEGICLRGLLSATDYFVYDESGLNKLNVPKNALANHMFLYGDLLSPIEAIRQYQVFDIWIERHKLTPEQTEVFIEMVTLSKNTNGPSMSVDYDKICRGIKVATS